MSDNPPVHVVANFTVHDAEKYRVYEKGFFPILKKHGGQFITLDDNSQTFEGKTPPRRDRTEFLDDAAPDPGALNKT